MKLYEVPNKTWVRLYEGQGEEHPIAHRDFEDDEELFFDHIDGMHSFCIDKDGELVHLKAWAEVEVLDEQPDPPNSKWL